MPRGALPPRTRRVSARRRKATNVAMQKPVSARSVTGILRGNRTERYSSGKVACWWVAVRHGVSTNGSDHIHLAVSLV
jgi:hypothetical protein